MAAGNQRIAGGGQAIGRDLRTGSEIRLSWHGRPARAAHLFSGALAKRPCHKNEKAFKKLCHAHVTQHQPLLLRYAPALAGSEDRQHPRQPIRREGFHSRRRRRTPTWPRGWPRPASDPSRGSCARWQDYRDQMREIVKQGLVDIMLMSASTSDATDDQENVSSRTRALPRPFEPMIPPTFICWPAALMPPSPPGRFASRDHRADSKRQDQSHVRRADARVRIWGCIRSRRITRSNSIILRLKPIKQFRIEAEQKGFRHFLEVFDPNACGDSCPVDLGRYINDLIVRTLAGVPSSGRPVFPQDRYHGPKAMEELVAYDPSLIPGFWADRAAQPMMHLSCWRKRRNMGRGRPSSVARSITASINLPSSDSFTQSPMGRSCRRKR